MSDYDYSFNSFIDHYILLLAARFRAPLDAKSICSSDTDPMDVTASWEQVACCVRDSLSRPQTAHERDELKHIEVDLFTADVCRERALYFQWKLQQKLVQDTPPADEPQLQQPTRKRRPRRVNAVGGPSSFDITKDSVQAAVENIYAAVRAHLPSTHDSNPPHGSGDESASDGESEVEVAEIPSRTEESEAMDLAVAEARDALLTKVQSLQAEFFAQHRRWVDVPLDLDGPPKAPAGKAVEPKAPAGKAVEPKAPAGKAVEPKAPAGKAVEPKAPAGKAVGSAEGLPLRAVEALRRDVLVDRPPRPSQMCEEDYVVGLDELHGTPGELEKAFMQRVRAAGGEPQQAVPPVEVVAENASRPNRWCVMEYEGDDSDDSDVMD